MPLSIQDQIKNQIESVQSILILPKPKASSDAVSESWVFFHLLKNMGKTPAILENNSRAEKLKFLIPPDKMEKKIVGARDFVLSFNTKYNKIISSRTEEKEGAFEIYITPKKEAIDQRAFSFIP